MRIMLVLVARTFPGFNEISDRLSATFGCPVGMDMVDFPITRSFRGKRNQYDAGAFLRETGRFSEPGTKAAFVLREDMFSGRLPFAFGLAAEDTCVVATARLDPRFYGKVDDERKAGALLKERILKELIHQLGHTLGLPNCRDSRCAMAPSASIEDVDCKEALLCSGCRKALKTEG